MIVVIPMKNNNIEIT